MGAVNAMLKVPAGGAPLDRASIDVAIDALTAAVALSPYPVRVVVRDRETQAAVERALAVKPELRATVVPLSG
jgi:hypothetical protein